jgi:hypothetical protein
LLIGLYVPAHFAIASGHFRSSLARKALNKHGRPIPWYTYPAVDYIARLDVAGCRVLEFGGGQSTLWWAERAKKVVTVELDAGWRSHLIRLVDGRVEVVTVAPEGPFDIVIIDGGERLTAARRTLEVIAEEGLVIQDNSDGYWGERGTYPILDLFEARGFSRVDFRGYAAGTRRIGCTSLFFGPSCGLLRGLPPPGRD